MRQNTQWIGFKPHEKKLSKVLGDLEADIMDALWRIQHGNVKEIHKEISQERKAAITTIATVLDRLHEKNLVERELKKDGGLHYEYKPAVTKKQFEKTVARAVLEGLFEAFGDSAISYLADRVAIKDKRTLEEFKRNLERLKLEAKSS